MLYSITLNKKGGSDNFKMEWGKKFVSYLLEKINIAVIPSPDRKIKTINVRRIFPILIFVFIFSSISVMGYLYQHYYRNYLYLTIRVNQLKNVQAENQHLKNELFLLSQDTELLKEDLSELIEYKNQIDNLIENNNDNRVGLNLSTDKVDLKLQTIFSFEHNLIQQGLPIGGGEYQALYKYPDEVIKKTKDNIEMVKKQLPSQKDKLNNLEGRVKEYNNFMASIPLIWPLADKGEGYISSDFGWRSDPFTGKQSLHEGLDIGVWYNTPVLATGDGRIKFAGMKGSYGYLVIIDHGYGFETRYAHLNKVKVKKGQKVSRGDIIAYSGNTGRSNGPHLHYEVRKNNIPQNPRNYIGR